MPKMIGDKLGWWYNNSNTAYQCPQVRITSEKLLAGQNIRVFFRLTFKPGNSVDPMNSQPVIEVGHGSATLKSEGPDWVVTSWQISRNNHWHYDGAE